MPEMKFPGPACCSRNCTSDTEADSHSTMHVSTAPLHTRTLHAARGLLRDPAVWAWLVVALLAILPARLVLAGG